MKYLRWLSSVFSTLLIIIILLAPPIWFVKAVHDEVLGPELLVLCGPTLIMYLLWSGQLSLTFLFTLPPFPSSNDYIYVPDPNYFDPSNKRSRSGLDDDYIRNLEKNGKEWRRTLETQVGRKVSLKAFNGTSTNSHYLGRVEMVKSEYVVLHMTEPFEVHQWIALENIVDVDPA